jgi:hypothetical protein
MSEPDLRDEQARAGTGPVDDEAAAEAEGLETRPGVAEHYREMTERGAHQQGEGRVP